GLAACNSQTASPFGCLNNFYFRILSNFLGSLHKNRGTGKIFIPQNHVYFLRHFGARVSSVVFNAHRCERYARIA
ncbi:MAG: hypothetical protein KH190_10290, partial [Clostridiales bacterium]|nr:hypothetical protein [Clostridiales bacterium]